MWIQNRNHLYIIEGIGLVFTDRGGHEVNA